MTEELSYPDYDPTDEELLLMFTWTQGKNGNIVKPEPIRFGRQARARFFPKSFKNRLFLFDHDKRIYYEETNTIRQWALNQISRLAELLEKPIVKPLTPEEESKGAVFEPAYYTLPPAQKLDSFLKDVYTQVLVGKKVVIEGDKFPFNQFKGIAVNNGVIVFDDDGMPRRIDRNHHHMFTRYLPVDYNPAADRSCVIEVLKQWLPDEDESYKWLIQIPAQAFFQSLPGISPFKQSYLLLGKPNSGKTSYSNLLLKLVGETNFSTHMLHELGDNFIVATLPSKMFNFGDDLPFIKIDASNKFKTLTGKRTMIVNPKFGRPYEADITAVFAFSANYAPGLVQQIQDDSGWWDRWAILNFCATGFQKDPTWEERTFTKEFMEGFLLLILFEVSNIIMNHGKLQLRQDPEDVKNQWVCDAQLFKEAFFSKYIEVVDDDYYYIGKKELCDSINAWIDGKYYTLPEGMALTEFKEQMPKTVQAITKAMKAQGIEVVKTRNDNGDTIRPYLKARWKHAATALAWCKCSDHSKQQ